MPKHHNKSKNKERDRANFSAWSEWIKDPGSGRNYSWRKDDKGNHEYYWQEQGEQDLSSAGYQYNSTNPGSASTSNVNAIQPTGGYTSQSYAQPSISYGLSNSSSFQAGLNPQLGYSQQNDYTYPGQSSLYPLSQSKSAADSLTQQLASTNVFNNSSGKQRDAAYAAYGNTPSNNPGLGSTVSYENSTFKIHASSFFNVGRVIKVLWSEPKGESSYTSVTLDHFESSKHPAFTKIRRFVVIRTGIGHCQCLPILTYQHQATTKHGVVADEHVAVYLRGQFTGSLPVVPGEQLSKEPIGIISASIREKLEPTSRLHLVKIYTVEHNVKVANIGEVASSDIARLKKYVQDTWTWEDWP